MSDEFIWPRDMAEDIEKAKAKGYVVEEHTPEGIRVTEHPSKAKAHAHGMSLRRAGNPTVYAFPKDSPFRSHAGKQGRFK